jgi:hypothetical protein
MKPQSRDVLELLRRHPQSGVTQQQAIAVLKCYRLAARVADLRAEGYDIVSESVTQGGVRFARYRLVPDPVQVTLFFADAS